MKRSAIILLVLLMLLHAAGLKAEVRRLTLDQAVRTALRENDALRASRYDVSARSWGRWNAVTQFFPRVEFNTTWSRVDETTFRNQNAQLEFFRQFVDNLPLIPRESYSSHLTVNQPIFIGGSLWANLSVARNNLKASQSRHIETRLNTILATKEAFFNVLRADDVLAIRSESIELARKYLESAERQRELGMLSNTDVIRWELQVAENRTQFVQASADAEVARLALKNTIGVLPEDSIDLVHLSEAEIETALNSIRHALESDFGSSVKEWKRQALGNSPSLKSVRAATAVKRAVYRQKYSLFQPSLNFNYTRSWEADDDIALDGLETWRMNIVMSFPLFSSFGDYAVLREARNDLKSSEASESDFERNLLIQVASTAAMLRTALMTVDAARISKRLAEQNLAAVENRFDQGLVDNLNLIDAQIEATSANAEYVSAVYNFLIRQAELDKLLGESEY